MNSKFYESAAESRDALSSRAGSKAPIVNGKPLRVALLVEATSAGVGRHVIDLARSLSQLGHEIHLLYSARRIDSRFSKGIADLNAIGVTICKIDIHHGLHADDARSIAAVRRYLNANGPFDVLHCHSTKAGFAGRLAALGSGIRTVYTPHALITMSPFQGRLHRRLASWMERSFAQFSDAFICVSDKERTHAGELGIPSSTLHTIPNGIDLSEAQQLRANRPSMRIKFGLVEGQVCVGYVGRLSPQKAPHLLLDAFALLPRNIQSLAKLVFIGNGPEEYALRKKIDELGLQNFVLVVGEFNGLQAMSAFDIFAISSRYEAFPYVMLEALSMGLPVISTNVGGVEELVHEGMNGFVVKNSVPRELAVALQELILHPELCTKMGAASIDIVLKFSLTSMAREVERVYRTISP
jgi:glycosyltransferase involved in cell wall biosynthesis